jgi:general secretion pathway protein K
MSGRRPRGAAVVIAMLLASRAVFHRRDQAQAQALAMAGIQWSRQILYEDARRTVTDHLGEPWALTLPPIPLDNGEIRGTIADAQARLNINVVSSTGAAADAHRTWVARLFAQRGGPGAALDAIADWIDRDNVPRPNGAEDVYYGGQAASGLAANAPLVRTAELATVRGVTPQALAAVTPFLAALPAGTPVNVNTAPPEVLNAVVENFTGDALAAFVASRAQKPFTTTAEFRARLPDGTRLRTEDALTVRSDFFYVTVEARQGTTRARARALVRRAGAEWPAVVWQIVE